MGIDLKNLNFKNIDLKDPKIQKVVLAVLVALMVIVLYVSLLFMPQLSEDIRLVRKAMKARRELVDARNLIAKKGEFRKRTAEYKEKIEIYERKLPAQQEIPGLLENLSKMARNTDISIVGITPVSLKLQKEPKGLVYKEIPIMITAKSGYHELGRFLSSLENADRFMKVVDIGIKANSMSPKKHDVELLVYTYVLSGE